MQLRNGVAASEIPGAVWVKSSASVGNGNCVEVAALADGTVAMRNSRFPDGPALIFTAGEIEAFVDGAKRAEFDQLTG
ncbi:transcriptional regulator [Streptomyces cirratus]|uniref:Transcriptional regulator n=1 Tax=Streptomyces cirratus TaxID=68187 RepID=A0ABQ3EWY3_9ACTN|nr:transcriptional regulator [Streptomyces cirratus]